MLLSKSWTTVYDNDVEAFIPEIWAQESLMILENQMIAANLVHRDFEREVANYGDVVNTRKPAAFSGKRKTDSDNVTIQDASATNVPVPLNQHVHVSFLIRDGQQSKGFKNLVNEFLRPAVIAMAEIVDQIVLSQVYRFRANSCGKLGTTVDKPAVIAAREVMNVKQVPMTGRNMIVTPGTEGDLLNIADFVNAEKVGDQGTALREGSIGRKFGLDFFMCQQTPQIATGSSTTTTALTSAAAAGATSLVVTAFGAGAHPVGAYLTVAGDMTPQRIVSIDDATETIVISPGLKYASSGATSAVTIYTPGAVNLGAGYAAGWIKPIVTNTFTVAPKKGQLASFGTAASEYALVNTPTTTGLEIDTPLAVAIANADAVNVGPAGSYNFGFHRNALALVVRPLAMPEAGTGAKAFVADYNGLSIRVVITYNGEKQGHLVTVDLLCGVATLDTSLGMVMYG
jgi:hypothetical protein